MIEPGGAPAEGAVVVSSAGGQAVTGQDGRYRLEVLLPVDSESVEITAVGASGAIHWRRRGRSRSSCQWTTRGDTFNGTLPYCSSVFVIDN